MRITIIYNIVLGMGFLFLGLTTSNPIRQAQSKRFVEMSTSFLKPDQKGNPVSELSYTSQVVLDDETDNAKKWTSLGSVNLLDHAFQLTSAKQSQKGIITSVNKIKTNEFELYLSFRIGGGSRIGADGMAIWLHKSTPKLGEVLGFTNSFDGIGILIDTYEDRYSVT